MLVNDGGEPPVVPAGFPLPVVRVDLAENRGRAAAAEAGVAAATGDYVAFLDDDDLAAPEHLATLAGLVSAAGVRVAYTDAAVAVYELDAEGGWVCRERRLPYSRDFDPDVLRVDNYIPFNTLLIERAAVRRGRSVRSVAAVLRGLGLPDPPLGPDPVPPPRPRHLRVPALPRRRPPRLRRAPPRARRLPGGQGAGARQARRPPPPRGAGARGRHPARRAGRRARGVGRRPARPRHAHAPDADLAALGRRPPGAGPRALPLGGALPRRQRRGGGPAARSARPCAPRSSGSSPRSSASAEVQRLYDDEGKLRAAVDDQTAHLGRTYAEIERLNGLIREMEATRAWRVHQWLGRRS